MRSCGLSRASCKFAPRVNDVLVVHDVAFQRRLTAGGSGQSPKSRFLTIFFCLSVGEQRRDKGGVGGKKTFPPKLIGGWIRRSSCLDRTSHRCSSWFQSDAIPPSPEGQLGLLLQRSSRSRGSSFYGGFEAPCGASSDDGLGTWRPILRELGPLPAQKGGLQRATWIHLTSRNLSCFHSVRFSSQRRWREPVAPGRKSGRS